MTESLDAFLVTVTTPVAWGDMDAFSHVNNTVYIKHFETARMAYFEKVGFQKGDVGPILASTYCRFRAPLAYPDTVRIGARVSDVGPDRFVMQYAVVSETQSQLAAEGFGLIVAYDYTTNSKTQIPKSVRAEIEALDAPRVHTFGPKAEVRVF